MWGRGLLEVCGGGWGGEGVGRRFCLWQPEWLHKSGTEVLQSSVWALFGKHISGPKGLTQLYITLIAIFRYSYVLYTVYP